ncbi:MutS family DNA mismatch repair protein [archaeon]|nr:MAG: MutS family DNA mismatch repair protein [archaeon]
MESGGTDGLDSSKTSSSKYIKHLVIYRNVDGEKKACQPLVDKYCIVGSKNAFASCLALMRKYLKGFGLEDALSSPEVSLNVGLQQEAKVQTSFHLDSVTARDLEIFTPLTLSPQASNKKQGYGSLFWLIDNCRSSYGRRTLKSWLASPLLLQQDILDRQEGVMWLAALEQSHQEYIKLIRFIIECFVKFPNIERTLSALQFGRISVSSLKNLLLFGQRLSQIGIGSGDSYVPKLLADWIRAINGIVIASQCAGFASNLLADDGEGGQEGSISSIFTEEAETNIPELHHLAEQQALARIKLQEILEKIRTEVRIPSLQFVSLRTGATSVVEHLIELPASFSKPVPSNWVKVSNTKSVMRFHTPEILRAQQDLYSVRDEIKLTTDRVWQKFIIDMRETLHNALRAAVRHLGNIDALLSLSEVAKYPNYCLPVYPDASNEVIIQDGRHPVLSRILEDQGEAFVPNDVKLSRDFLARSCQVLTGPNMGGKSSYVRMLGSICLLGQIGSCVPAENASLCIFDNIFTRMGAEDDLSLGRSTFMCELVRTSKILHSATSSSLVMIDELGRGTSTHDGCAIALATLKYFIHKIGSMTVFVTHFPEVARYIEEEESNHKGRGCNAHMSYMESEGSEEEGQQVVFLYKLVRHHYTTLTLTLQLTN